MLVLDMTWITIISAAFYRMQMGALLSGHPVLWAAIAFYVVYLLAVAYFAIGPALAARSLKVALGNGAFLGLAAYATYDLTNLAVITNWSVSLSFVDMAWGIFLTAVTSAGAYLLATKVFKF